MSVIAGVKTTEDPGAIGLDLSLTCTGLAVVSEKQARTATISPPRGQGGRFAELAPRIVKSAWALAKEMQVLPLAWLLEGYAYGMARGNAVAGLAELAGVVKFLLEEVGVQVIIVPPARLKKFVTGRGNARKDEMRHEVYKRWSFEARTVDEIDAYALARLGGTALGWFRTTTSQQAEVAVDVMNQVRAMNLGRQE